MIKVWHNRQLVVFVNIYYENCAYYILEELLNTSIKSNQACRTKKWNIDKIPIYLLIWWDVLAKDAIRVNVKLILATIILFR